MHRLAAASLLALALLSASPPTRAASLAPVAQSAAPHAWLFGIWTGGLFPVAAGITAQACLAQPTVIFTRDVVLRATLTEVPFDQRVVETARTSSGTTDFRFSPSQDPVASTGSGLLGMEPPKAPAGFGCESPDVLHVLRHTDNEISFPGCEDFPNPLVRCPSR